MSRAIDPRAQHEARMFPRRRDPIERLTGRQRLIIDMMSRPGSRPSVFTVAAELDIAPQTVKNHLQSAYRTLGVHTLGQAVRVILDRRAA
jgi:DNA-binding NarL/FixJ family response regulator